MRTTCSSNIFWRICEWLQLWWSCEWCFSRSNPCSSERWKQKQPCVGKEVVSVTGSSRKLLYNGNGTWEPLFFSKGIWLGDEMFFENGPFIGDLLVFWGVYRYTFCKLPLLTTWSVAGGPGGRWSPSSGQKHWKATDPRGESGGCKNYGEDLLNMLSMIIEYHSNLVSKRW